MGSSSESFRMLADKLASAGRVVALDWPGHGQSPDAEFGYTMADFAELLAKVMTALRLERPIIVGHSLGGQVAMTLLVSRPQIASALILVAPAGIETFSPNEREWLESVQSPAVIRDLPEATVRERFRALTFEPRANLEELIQRRLATMRASDGLAAATVLSRCVRGMLHGPVRGSLSAIAMPTLVVFGENDNFIPNQFLHPQATTAELGRAARDAIANAKLLLLPRTGHLVPEEAPDQLAAACLTFAGESLPLPRARVG
jgi:pimeloyl-ACP methyl ester carboxylesterase